MVFSNNKFGLVLIFFFILNVLIIYGSIGAGESDGSEFKFEISRENSSKNHIELITAPLSLINEVDKTLQYGMLYSDKELMNMNTTLSLPAPQSLEKLSNLEALQVLPVHNPIIVDGNTNFTSHGVFSGFGNKTHPYVFKDYFINAGVTSGVNISNSDAYFKIENIWVNGSATASGLFFKNVSNGLLINNIATNNSQNGFYFLGGSKGNTLINNTANNNINNGFSVLSPNNTLIDNNATDNGNSGFYLEGSDNNMTINTAILNHNCGFSFFLSNNNTLLNNNAMNNTFHGFLLDISMDNILINNSAENNDAVGFYLNSLYNNSLTNNRAIGNVYGFGLQNANYNNLTDNFARDSSDLGFVLLISSNNTLITNNASSNVQNGFYLFSSNKNTLINNKASNNVVHGFYLIESAENIIINNTATMNTNGFYLENIDNNILRNNNVTNNINSSLIIIGVGSSNQILANRFVGNFLSDVQDNSTNYNWWYGNIYGANMIRFGEAYSIPGTAGAIDLNPIPLDTDSDGMPDWYEIQTGLDKNIDDSSLNPDNDSFTNLEEYFLGTDPFVDDSPTPSTTTSTETTTTTNIQTTTNTIIENSFATITSQIVETITKTTQGFGIVFISISILGLILIRRKKLK